MKNVFKKLVPILALVAGIEVYAANCNTSCNTNTGCGTTSPFLFTRSQGRNKVLQVVGEVGHTHLDGMESLWDNTTVLVAYERSFRTNRITECLFGTGLNTTNTLTTTGFNNSCNTNCDTTSIQIQGSAVKSSANSWLADNFYLAPDFQSTISFRPRISNVLVYLDEYIGMDELLCGFYLRLYGPLVHTRWDLSFCESNISTGSLGYPAGYFAPDVIPNKALLQTFGDYAAGVQPNGGLTGANGVLLQPLKYAKIRKESNKRTGFADLRAELGWDFWQTECYHVGFNIQMAAPTGNSPDADYVFDPVIGNGNHWELGGGVTAHYLLWANEAEDANFGVYLDANVTHLFKARQQRTFDLIGKPVSRYQLAERIDSGTNGTLFANPVAGTLAGSVAPTAQFLGEFAPVANLTTADVKVSIGAQADIVLWLNYSACNWSVDLGYNLWVTSREKYNTRSDCHNDCRNPYYLCNSQPVGTWALKGDARVFGFPSAITGLTATGTGVALSATESNSTIFGGTNAAATTGVGALGNDPLYHNNAGVDNPQFATTIGSELFTNAGALLTATTQIETSSAPLALCCASVDQVSHKGLTNKIFGHVSYTLDCECVVPYFGVGGSAEFASRKCSSSDCVTPTAAPCPIPATNVSSSNCNTSCDENRNSSRRCTPSLWSVWANVGVTFN